MIVCFSGTGNSLAVAKRLAATLGHEPVTMLTDLAAEPADDQPIVWVFPIYGWRVPRLVREAIKKISRKRHHYMVATCGDDIGRAAHQWRQLVRSAGGTPRGAWSVIMPNTYVFLPGFKVDSEELSASKLAAMPSRVDAIARLIADGSDTTDVTEGGMPWIKTNVLGPLFEATLMSPSGFRVDRSKCNGCGHCARTCPLGNITIAEGHPAWGPNCALCSACYHACPRQAIAHGPFRPGGQKKFCTS